MILLFIGLIWAVPIFIFSALQIRKSTIPFLILLQLFSIGLSAIFDWRSIGYTGLFAILIGVLKYRALYNYESNLDYSYKVFSVGGLIQAFTKNSKDIYCGRILPISKRQLKHNKKLVSMSDELLSGSTLITGSTGSGKTSTMLSIMRQVIDQNKPVVFFDYKGETDILDKLQEYCSSKNIPYYEFSSRSCTFSYDPLVRLNSTGRVEALMNTRRWDASGADEHYRTSTQLVIQSLIHAYDEYRLLQNDESSYLVGLKQFTNHYKPSQNERDGFNTLCKQLDILLSSSASQLFEEHNNVFSFEQDGPYVICFSFISANKALANSLSSFIFQDIMDRGTRRKYTPKLLLCIDEFGTLESSTLIKDILEKGRSGGCQTIFSVLDINQLAMSAGEHFVHAILGTINSFLIHAGATQKTAELLASVQKYENQGYSIMDLRKPFKGKPPTALFISKYPILSKKGNQEMYRIEPYIYDPTIRKQMQAHSAYTEKPTSNLTNIEIEYDEQLEEVVEEFEHINEDSNQINNTYSIDDLDDLL